MRVLLGVSPTYQRCLVLATFALLVCGCGSKGLHEPLPQAKAGIEVTAPWHEGATIPRRYTCDGAGTAPKIRSDKLPAQEDRAIVMTDPDAPGGTFVHWTAWGAAEGRNSFGKTGYSGPCPPKGDKPHRYVITVYALRNPLGLAAGASPEDVVDAIKSDTLAKGSVTGLYGR